AHAQQQPRRGADRALARPQPLGQPGRALLGLLANEQPTQHASHHPRRAAFELELHSELLDESLDDWFVHLVQYVLAFQSGQYQVFAGEERAPRASGESSSRAQRLEGLAAAVLLSDDCCGLPVRIRRRVTRADVPHEGRIVSTEPVSTSNT